MLLVALLSYALQAPPPSPLPADARSSSTSVAEKVPEPTKGLRKSIRATMGAIDTEQMTVRFVDEKAVQKVWPVDRRLVEAAPARAQQLAKAFQPGDPIYVVYQEDDGHPVITELARRTAQDDEIDKNRRQEGKQ